MNINESGSGSNFKSSFYSGECSREEYWKVINSSLNEVRKVQHLLGKKIVKIEVTNTNLILEYQFWKFKSILLVIPKDDLRTAPLSILANGHYEALLEDVIFELAISSRMFLDIGANLGFYSVGASIVNNNLKVLAFEPNPSIKGFLLENTRLNQVENRIEISEWALSDFAGNASFSVPAFTGSGGGSLQNLHPEEGAPLVFSVKVEKLDNLQNKTQGIDLIKIDVEGSEFQLIKGALETIEGNKPTIVIELLRKWMKPFRSKPQDVVEILHQQNYICFAVGANDMRRISLIDEETQETNFIFCHQHNLEHLKILNSKCKQL